MPTPEVASKALTSLTARKLKALVARAATLMVAVFLMIWGAFNASTNILDFFKDSSKGEQAWGIAAVLILLTTLIPFLGGLWLLLQTTRSQRTGPRNSGGKAREKESP